MPSQGKGEGGKADLLNIIIHMYHLQEFNTQHTAYKPMTKAI